MHVGTKLMVSKILSLLIAASFCLLAGPVAAAESAPAGDEEARTFIAQWLDLSQKNENFDKVMGLYADEVNFYKLGRVKREAVRADKRKYFDRWQSREHRLISVAVGPATTNNAKEVSVSFHYKIKNAKGKVKEGDANAVLILQRAKNAFVIVSEKEATVAAQQDAGVISEPGKEATTRAGTLTIRKDGERGDALYLNEGKISEGYSQEIVKVLNGRNADFVLVASYSGGIACPATAIIMELHGPKKYRISEEFGSCSDIMAARLEGDGVVVEMPAFTGHPELLDEEGRKSLYGVKEIFAWKNGKLTKSSTDGLDFKRCFPQTGAGAYQVLEEMLAETKNRCEKDVHKVKPEQHDVNNDGHPDWFIATDVCSAVVGCFGDVYLYYEKNDVCPGHGYCYAGSNYNVLLATPDMHLKCEANYRDLAE